MKQTGKFGWTGEGGVTDGLFLEYDWNEDRMRLKLKIAVRRGFFNVDRYTGARI